MGIKFRCPNGHKLNVKSFLAGKRGVCPKCGTSLRIPELPAGSEPAEGADDGEGEDLLDEARFPAPGRALAVAATATASNGGAALPHAPAEARQAVPVPAAIPVPAAVSADPIAEAPTAVWYVRPPSGDQYGPARGEVMRRWIAEGRVSNDSLVWREGWSDWRAAGEIFPSLQPATVQPPAAPVAAPARPSSSAPAAAKEPPEEEAPRSKKLIQRYEIRKQQGSGLGIVAIILLGLLCVLLGALLVYVFVFYNNGPAAPPSAPQARANVAPWLA